MSPPGIDWTFGRADSCQWRRSVPQSAFWEPASLTDTFVLRPGVQPNPGEELAHPEISILDYMAQNSIKPIVVGAGRPVCPECALAIEEAAAVA
jgi:hypothetical protein